MSHVNKPIEDDGVYVVIAYDYTVEIHKNGKCLRHTLTNPSSYILPKKFTKTYFLNGKTYSEKEYMELVNRTKN